MILNFQIMQIKLIRLILGQVKTTLLIILFKVVKITNNTHLLSLKVKKNNQREPFDRDKLARSMMIALRKRPVDPDRIERVVNGIVGRLESSGETEIKVDTMGALVMEALATLDQVAYVRFASVYRNFREAKDFEEFITDDLAEEVD